MKKLLLLSSLIIFGLITSGCQKMNAIDQCKNDCLDAKKNRDKTCLEDQDCAKNSATEYDSCIQECSSK